MTINEIFNTWDYIYDFCNEQEGSIATDLNNNNSPIRFFALNEKAGLKMTISLFSDQYHTFHKYNKEQKAFYKMYFNHYLQTEYKPDSISIFTYRYVALEKLMQTFHWTSYSDFGKIAIEIKNRILRKEYDHF